MPLQEGERGRQRGDLRALSEVRQPLEHSPPPGARRDAHHAPPPRSGPALSRSRAPVDGLDDGTDDRAHGVGQVGAEPGSGRELDGMGGLVQADPGRQVEHVQVQLAAHRQHVGGHEQQVRGR